MIILILYSLVFLLFGIFEAKKAKDFDEYVIAGGQQKTFAVTASLSATILGGSATMGVIKTASIAHPWAYWWLPVGVVGLIFQGLFLSDKIKATKSYTLPDLMGQKIGKEAKIFSSVIIVLAWIWVVAGQFLAAQTLVSILVPEIDSRVLLVFVAAVMVLYTVFGGQLSIIKTDIVQFLVLGGGFLLTFAFLYFGSSSPVTIPRAMTASGGLFSENYTPFAVFSLLIITGGSYFVGPDMFSRAFSAKDSRTAKKSAFLTAGIVLVFSVVFVLIGLYANVAFPGIEAGSSISSIFESLPRFVSVIFALALLSAVISSGDTTLVTAAATVEKDLIGKKSTTLTRALIAVFGILAMVLALFGGGILDLLFNAYSLYTPSIVAPLAVALISKKKPHRVLITSGIGVGALFGLASVIFGLSYLSLLGVLAALILSLISILKGETI